MSMHRTNPEHEIAYQELNDLVKRCADKYDLSAVELLAVAANMLGKLVAMQDKRVVSARQAMEIVARNLEVGNQQAVKHLSSA